MGFLNTQSVVKYQKKLKEGPFGENKISEKNLSAEKTERGDPLGFSNIHSDAKQQKNEEGTHWGKKIPKKNLEVPKKLKGGPFGLARYGMLRRKTGKTFLVQFARPNGAIWCNNIL